MKLHQSLVGIALASLLFDSLLCLSCSRRCDNHILKPLTGKMEDYFGVYKPGNWWVYNNKTGAKTDSQYVVNYEDTFWNNRTNCERTQVRTFVIVNTQLPSGPPLYVGDSLYLTYEAFSMVISLHGTPSVPGTKHSAGFPKFEYYFDTDSITSNFYPGYYKNLFDSISLNGMKYYNILTGYDGTGTFYFEKNKGMVGWGNVLDTFNLVRYKIL